MVKRKQGYPRPFTGEEKELRIDRTQPLGVPPRDFCNVIWINSTYLEVVDRAHALCAAFAAEDQRFYPQSLVTAKTKGVLANLKERLRGC